MVTAGQSAVLSTSVVRSAGRRPRVLSISEEVQHQLALPLPLLSKLQVSAASCQPYLRLCTSSKWC